LLDFTTGPVFVSLRGLHPSLFDAGVADDTVARHTQIGRGSLDGELGIIPLQNGSVHTCHHSVTIRTEGQFGANQVSVFVGLAVPSPTRVLGQPVRRDSIVAFNPRSVVDDIDGAGLRWASLSIPVSDFTQAAFDLTRTEWSLDALPTVVLRPDRRAIAGLRATLNAVIAVAHAQPSFFHDPHWRENAERSLRSTYLSALLGSSAKGPATVTAPLLRAGTILRAIDDYLDYQGDGLRPVAELCRAAGVPRRTLERAFEQMFDFGPAEYLRRRALNAVHRELLNDRDTAHSVTDVALAHGFWHLGRFSQQYRLLFGELPSETVRRSGWDGNPDIARLEASLVPRHPANKKGRGRSLRTAHGLA